MQGPSRGTGRQGRRTARWRAGLAAAGGAAAALLAVAACGSAAPGHRPAGGPTAPELSARRTAEARQASARPTADVAVRETRLGAVLVDHRGRTLYAFTADAPGRDSDCTAACLQSRPAATPEHGTPRRGPGVAAAVAVAARPDGTRQLTAAGRPLYTSAGDHRAGEATAQGEDAFGGTWWAVGPDGDPVTVSATAGSGLDDEQNPDGSDDY